MQPDLKIFPRTLMGDRRRSFKAAWYHIHPWLEYSKQLDSAYCYACRHFSPPNSQDTVFDSPVGFKNWKKACYKTGGFALHARSERHKQAMVTWRDYQRAAAANATLANALNKEHNRQINENRAYIKTIGEVLLLTATQNMAQRGHDESADSDNKGNFKAILDTIANHDRAVKKRLTSIHNAKYTSKMIQNEVLGCLADMVRTEITEEVKNSEVFSIIADETKDVKKKEQISIVLRYYYSGAIQESFLHFESTEKLDAAGLSEKIIQILENHGLEYKKNLVGQAYDGASVMSGKHSGVQARIRERAKYAFYIHCTAHCLNLVLVDTVKAIPEVEEFFYLLEKLYVFTSGSAVHPKWLAIQREMYKGAPRELQRLSDTRWACRFIALRNIMDRLPALKRLLQEIAQERNGEKSVEARGLLAQIDFEFTVHLVTLRKVFGETKLLSDMLQSSTLDISKAVDLVDALVKTLNDFRQESFFDDVWDEVLNVFEQCDPTPPAAKRQKTLSSKLSQHCVLTTLGQRESERDKDGFRTNFFYPVIDLMLSELQRRFSSKNCEIMNSIPALNPQKDTFLKEKDLFSFAQLYDSNIDDLGHELHQFKRILERKIQAGMQRPSSTVQLVQFIEPYKEVFFELYRLCKIAVAIPVSTAACERSFSTLKLVKTYLRSTMNDDRLSNLGVLSIESRRAKALSLDSFVDRFARNHQNRRIQLL
ncbi:zinc finger MYM-type protein 1-like isoform X2 [Toxotes jaculatrix]|nr:zinc finger MYM-type protein 1-like isoform X2 [Toxotes jaculatrix]XP_040909227.1 zinc finger MYM-type protein 1-like isoform X2 [Toxotes jaculatrix]XP_040911061.1 zinc finger MYM-type protein 1-like isoform X2 [Toxotes jaculatrix]XP_040913396.1 zinc finger MYM-type protein 1-like isoform X2 [Toxotes jaculatrix]